MARLVIRKKRWLWSFVAVGLWIGLGAQVARRAGGVDAAAPVAGPSAETDLDADGRPDTVLSFNDDHGGLLALHLGTGRSEALAEPAAADAVVAVPDRVDLLVAADLTGDGLPDLVTGALGARRVHLVQGLSGGALAPARPVDVGDPLVGLEPAGMVGTGADLAVVTTGRAGKTLSVLLSGEPWPAAEAPQVTFAET